MSSYKIEEQLRLGILSHLRLKNITQRQLATETGLCPKYLNGFLQGEKRIGSRCLNILQDHIGVSFINPNLIKEIEENHKRQGKWKG